MPRIPSIALALLFGTAPAARADSGFVVVANSTDSTVRFDVSHGDAAAAKFSLGPGEARRIPVGRHPDLSFDSDGKPFRFRLEPYAAYVFTPSRSGIALQGIEMAALLPESDDLPKAPPKADKPFTLAVRVMLDDTDPRKRVVWEKAVRERVVEASEILKRECGVVLKVASTGVWTSDRKSRTAADLLTDFEKKVKPDAAAVMVGFSSRPVTPPAANKRCCFGVSRGPIQSHILLSESVLASEADRTELLAHELAHLLGAVHSPDPVSLMRPTVADGKARAKKFRIGLDPLNMLAVGIWVEEMRRGEVRKWEDLRPPARARLAAVYKTIARALPDDPIAGAYAVQLDRLAPVAKVEARENDLTEKQQAVQRVVRAVAIRAADLSRKPEAERLKGDELTAELVRTAAGVAATAEESLQPAALAIGLGLALDHSTTLRDNPLTRRFCRAIETDDERRERLAVLGSPTMRGRRDLCQHFVVSAALAELLGPEAAEAAGLLKERLDMAGKSGFSFADLAADLSGVAFSRKLRADNRAVARTSVLFEVEEFVPDAAGLREGLTKKQFRDDYGSESDPRFGKVLDDIRKRVRALPGYK